jgi:hypothetical protein
MPTKHKEYDVVSTSESAVHVSIYDDCLVLFVAEGDSPYETACVELTPKQAKKLALTLIGAAHEYKLLKE